MNNLSQKSRSRDGLELGERYELLGLQTQGDETLSPTCRIFLCHHRPCTRVIQTQQKRQESAHQQASKHPIPGISIFWWLGRLMGPSSFFRLPTKLPSQARKFSVNAELLQQPSKSLKQP
jgi:hypothetical protein